MLRMIIVPIFLLAAIACCMGQTFQYSRGWTNGKRSNTHFREESLFPDVIDMDTEKKLEKCLLNLQRFIHNPYILHTSLLNSASNTNNKYPTNGHHQSNDILDDIVNPDTIDFIKSQT